MLQQFGRDMSRHMAHRTTFRLPDDLLARAKRRAFEDGRTLTALVEDGLRHVVDGPLASHAPRRVELPVSKATGGPMPGYENLTYSEIEELDDLEYMERLDRQHKRSANHQR